MKHIQFIVMVAILLALMSVLPAVAQNEVPGVDFTFNGVELQKLEDGVVVQAWSMPISLETQQTVALLNARAQTDDPDMRYVFDQDRMYHLRDNQIVDLWLLRGGQWIASPGLNVQYVYNGQQLQRVVNGEIQQAWTLPIGQETQQTLMVMQAEANKAIAGRIFAELHVRQAIEHMPALVAEDFALHYIPLDGAPDMTWYTPKFVTLFAMALMTPTNEPVVFATEDMVVTQHPAGTNFAALMGVPPIADDGAEALYDLYRIEDGRVTDLWLGYNLSNLIAVHQ